jgi:hypothetical protein
MTQNAASSNLRVAEILVFVIVIIVISIFAIVRHHAGVARGSATTVPSYNSLIYNDFHFYASAPFEFICLR